MTTTRRTISFLGAADTVTGSRYLVSTPSAKVLVDCGLFQGYKKLRERNWRGLTFDAASIDAVVLTHAHIDHSGYLPRLAELGFSGPVYCTSGTADLLEILLPDSGHLQEEAARRANKYGYTKHAPALPLYTREQAERVLGHLVTTSWRTPCTVAPGMHVTFRRAGHILGSASVALEVDGRTITFTGDVGRPSDPIMQPAELLEPTDYLVTESTYGDRRHPPEEVRDVLARIVTETAARGGVVVVPAFAVGRAQHLLHLVAQLKAADQIPDLPIFLDSPMAIDATRIFSRHPDDHRIDVDACRAMCRVAQYVHTAEQSKTLDTRQEPMIIISASGMLTGGRVLHHLRRFLPDERNTVLFVGFQAAGTRGRALVDGADEVKVLGEYVPVRAQIAMVEGLSAHADYREMLTWLRASKISPRRAFVTHGEPAAADAFRRRLEETFDWDVVVPDPDSRWVLD